MQGGKDITLKWVCWEGFRLQDVVELTYCFTTEVAYYRIAGSFGGRKLSRFRGLVATCENFFMKFGGMASFGGISKQSTSFLCKNLIFDQCEEVFAKVSHCTVY